MDRDVIQGIIFANPDNVSLWTGFSLSEKETDQIYSILNEHDTEGCSISGTWKDITEEMLGKELRDQKHGCKRLPFNVATAECRLSGNGMSEEEKALMAMKMALEHLRQTWTECVEAFSNIHIDCNDYIVGGDGEPAGYPFHMSFDELNVVGWVDKTLERIKHSPAFEGQKKLMMKISSEEWDKISPLFKGEWQDYYNEHPEWIGRRVVMSSLFANDPAELGGLLIEGIDFVIN